MSDPHETTSLEGTPDSTQARRLQQLAELVNGDASLVRRGRFVTLDFCVRVGRQSCFISVVDGRIEKVAFKPQRMRSAAFVIRAEPEHCERFWQPMPQPWSQDLFAMAKKGNAFIEGNQSKKKEA